MASSTVRRKDSAEVHTWFFGDEPPEGYTVQVSSDGKRNAVKMDGTEVVRNAAEEAVAIPEGGGLIVHPDGTHTAVPAKTIPKPIPQDDGGVNWTTEQADNDSGVREALRAHGYDADSWDNGSAVDPETTPEEEGV